MLGLKPDARDYMDIDTFAQILEMDDDDEEGERFSHGLVFGFFEQAEATFGQMEDGLTKKDLEELSSLGHFLKGSSATLGLYKIRDACEKIQHLGAMMDAGGDRAIENDAAGREENLIQIRDILAIMRKDFFAVKKWLEEFYIRD